MDLDCIMAFDKVPYLDFPNPNKGSLKYMPTNSIRYLKYLKNLDVLKMEDWKANCVLDFLALERFGRRCIGAPA